MQLGAADAYRAEELADAHAFFSALAQRAAAFEWRTPADFAGLLQDLFSAPGATRANPVQVMTIHRAKGLEFDHVLVPALDKATGGAERRLLRWMDLPRESGGSDLLIAPAPAVGAAEEDDLDAYLKELVRRRDANERARLMYVAATRARETLWLSGAPPLDARGAVSPDRRSLLSTLWPALAQRFQSVTAAAGGGGARARPHLPAPAARVAPAGSRARRAGDQPAAGAPQLSSPPSSAGSGRPSVTSARWCTRGWRAWRSARALPSAAQIAGRGGRGARPARASRGAASASAARPPLSS